MYIIIENIIDLMNTIIILANSYSAHMYFGHRQTETHRQAYIKRHVFTVTIVYLVLMLLGISM